MDKQFIKDSSPFICPAGITTKISDHVPDVMKHYPLEDKVTAIKHEANIPDKPNVHLYKLPKLQNIRNYGIFSEVQKTLSNPVTTRFQQVITDLKETTYPSYWVSEVGKCRDTTGKLPLHIHPYETTFGIKSVKDTSVKELVNPDKDYDTVSKEYWKGHELYKKSHNRYEVNERIERNYLQPAYNPKSIFGEKTIYDPRGIWVKCNMKEENGNKYEERNQILSDYQAEFKLKLGKPSAPSGMGLAPDSQTFGIPTNACSPIVDNLTENPQAQIKKDIELYMTFLLPLRANLKKKFNKFLLNFSDLFAYLKYRDKAQTGWLPLNVVYDVCAHFNVHFDTKILEKLLELLEILKDGLINYKRFVELLNWQCEFPDFGSSYYVKPEKQYYLTTYKAATLDHLEMDNSKMRPAGLGTFRYDTSARTYPVGGCRADIESLPQETEAVTVLYPSVFTSYGLSFEDIFLPREKIEMFNLFTKIGFEFDKTSFDKLWEEGVENDKTGLVCVDTFRNLITKHNIKYNEKHKAEGKICPE